MHGFKHPCLHYLLVTNVYFDLFVFVGIVKLMDCIPIIALICMDINNFAYTICLVLIFYCNYVVLA